MSIGSGAVRPLYETDDNRRREAEILEAVAEAWAVRVQKLPPKDPLDAVLMRNDRVLAYVEVKDRTTNNSALRSTDLPRIIISTSKVEKANSISRSLQAQHGPIDVVALIRFADRTVWFSLVTAPHETGYSGRKDRGDPQDMEPVCWFDAAEFRDLSDLPAFLR